MASAPGSTRYNSTVRSPPEPVAVSVVSTRSLPPADKTLPESRKSPNAKSAGSGAPTSITSIATSGALRYCFGKSAAAAAGQADRVMSVKT